MGDAYARNYLNLDFPRVALLNNGEEEGKGYHELKETYGLLKQSTLNFTGNIEGKAMFKDLADVVVCDGFIGNIALKVAEGTFDFVRTILSEEIKGKLIPKLGPWAQGLSLWPKAFGPGLVPFGPRPGGGWAVGHKFLFKAILDLPSVLA